MPTFRGSLGPRAVLLLALAATLSSCAVPLSTSSQPELTPVIQGGSVSSEDRFPEKASEDSIRTFGHFGTLAYMIEEEFGFTAPSDIWLAARERNCSQDLKEIPEYPAQANAVLPTVGERNSFALRVWGISIGTHCLERIDGVQLSLEAFQAVTVAVPDLDETTYLNPYDRLSSLGEFGLMAAKLEAEYNFGASADQWTEIAEKNCTSMEDDEYTYWSFQKEGVGEESWRRVWGASLAGNCREHFPTYSREAGERRAFWEASLGIPTPSEWGVKPGQLSASVASSGAGPGSSSQRSGRIVICKDGWVSYSGGKQGACSWHGGVR